MTELEIVTAAAAVLRSHGQTSIEYITAEFNPFSDQFRPDLVFHPNVLPGHTFFVEYRLGSSHVFRQPPEVHSKQLAEHRGFIGTEPSITLHFAFASSGDHDPNLAASLAANQIAYFAPTPTPDLLAASVLIWVDATKVRSIA